MLEAFPALFDQSSGIQTSWVARNRVDHSSFACNGRFPRLSLVSAPFLTCLYTFNRHASQA
jgi:hypothetical protein